MERDLAQRFAPSAPPGLAPLTAYGWREGDAVVWQPLVERQDPCCAELAGRDVPRLAPGRRRRWQGRALRYCAVGVGPDLAVALAFGPRGYLPPPGQRAAIAALWEGRLRVLPGGPPPPRPGAPFLDRALVSAADVVDARQALHARLAASSDPEWALRVAVAATEAMINALRHAGEGRIAAWWERGDVHVEVADAGPGLPFPRLVAAVLRPRDPAGAGMGYGYWLMLTYARACEVVGGGGTRVRLRFTLRGRRREKEMREASATAPPLAKWGIDVGSR